MLFGLGAALGWGLADFGVALVSRRIGSFTTLVLAQLGGLLLFAAMLAFPAFSLPPFRPALFLLPLIGISGALGYVAFYRALQLGPIALVTPIGAGYAAIVITLSLVFLRESVPPMALTGAIVTIAGVAVTSTDWRRLRAERPRERGGIFYALLAMTGFGLGAFLIAIFAKDTGWFGSILLSRVGSALTLAVILGFIGVNELRQAPASTFAPAMIMGVLDIFGFAAFARGSELGYVSITAAASVTYPLIPILGGVLYFRERPAPNQVAGVAVVVGGLVLMAFGR
ncbi:MAG TPA: DMT family transporter [Actinomycetota bacterium]|nr:DMT family transporter [Actinomycetota bacterium]